MKNFLTIALLIILNFCNAQSVDTFVDDISFTMNHGCVISTDGIIFSTDVIGNGSYNGQNVYKTLTNGSTTLFANGFNGAAGLTMDDSGNLFVSELNTGRIWKVLPNGTKSIYANGVGVPAGLAFDSSGNLFVANFQFDNILKVLPNGSVSTFGNTDAEPVGIIIDENDNLYVSHEEPHTISKITPSGTVSNFANIPGTKFQYLAYFGENILVTGYTDHRIYLIEPNGNWSIFSGNGVSGNTNGNIDQAQYNAPTGIGVFDDGDNRYIYIVEGNKIRKITTSILSTNDFESTIPSIKFYKKSSNKLAVKFILSK